MLVLKWYVKIYKNLPTLVNVIVILTHLLLTFMLMFFVINVYQKVVQKQDPSIELLNNFFKKVLATVIKVRLCLFLTQL